MMYVCRYQRCNASDARKFLYTKTLVRVVHLRCDVALPRYGSVSSISEVLQSQILRAISNRPNPDHPVMPLSGDYTILYSTVTRLRHDRTMSLHHLSGHVGVHRYGHSHVLVDFFSRCCHGCTDIRQMRACFEYRTYRTFDDHRRPLVPSWDNSLSD